MRAFILAGEPSGDKLGGALMAGLKRLHPDIRFQGVGGAAMEAEGLDSLFDMDDLSVMGLLEVLPRIPKLLRRIKQTVTAAQRFEPDVLITIDSPDFCLRVAEKLKATRPNLKVVHYVAPSVWAWRPERAEKMARHVDHVLALLPFEPPYMTVAGMSCDFVGHPIVAERQPTGDETAAFAQEQGIDPERPVVCLLPGSRKGELSRMGPIHGEVARRIATQVEGVQFVLPAASAVVNQVKAMVEGWEVAPFVLDPRGFSVAANEHRKRMVFTLSDAALATSGTVALELAAASCPMVVGYKANYLTTRMVKKLAQIDTANLINIVTQTREIPEFLFETCTPDLITPALLALLKDTTVANGQKEACAQTMQALGLGGEDPGDRAARSVLAFLDRTD
ncbi:lipid-A-disaccharide synthase [Neptunicoccus cionae]|uniref:lipid-A-disaccharide synthase n=1 Tax=Neptunicoccus cionae TaxID=2035344 RepID=UPI000C7644C2|nr:lipid-A-disaccharide synthase [Amylibacter cionae]PLS20261.1 lipid-A-disaccharide synthase [Amylibacter cionae]